MTKRSPGEEIDVYLCVASATWPLEVFESESHAIEWMRAGGQASGTRHVHRAKIIVGEELVLHVPQPRFVTKTI